MPRSYVHSKRSTTVLRPSYVEIDDLKDSGEQETAHDNNDMPHSTVCSSTSITQPAAQVPVAESHVDEALDDTKTSAAARAEGEL